MILLKEDCHPPIPTCIFSRDAFAGLADHTLVCKRMPCLSYSHMTYDIWRQQFVIPELPDKWDLFSEADENSWYDDVVRWSKLHGKNIKHSHSALEIFGIFNQRNGNNHFYSCRCDYSLTIWKQVDGSQHTLSLLQASRQPEEALLVEVNPGSWKTDGARLDAGECSFRFRYCIVQCCEMDSFSMKIPEGLLYKSLGLFNTSQPGACNDCNQPCVGG